MFCWRVAILTSWPGPIAPDEPAAPPANPEDRSSATRDASPVFSPESAARRAYAPEAPQRNRSPAAPLTSRDARDNDDSPAAPNPAVDATDARIGIVAARVSPLAIVRGRAADSGPSSRAARIKGTSRRTSPGATARAIQMSSGPPDVSGRMPAGNPRSGLQNDSAPSGTARCMRRASAGRKPGTTERTV